MIPFNKQYMCVFADIQGHPYQLVQAASILVVAAFLFLMFRFFVFPASGAKTGGAE